MRDKVYARALRKYWWVILGFFVLAEAGAVLITLNTPKQYATSMTFFVKTPSDQLSTAAVGDTFGQKRVNSYIQLAFTDRLLKPVLSETAARLSVAQLASEISATADANTVLLRLAVTDKSPAQSLAIANSLSKQFVSLIANLESNTPGGDTTVRLELVSGPTLAGGPVSPRPAVNYALGALIGLILGISVAILREALDTTIRSSSALERTAGSSVLGAISYDDSARAHPLIVDGKTKSVRAEAFRQLRTNLQFVDVDSPFKTLVITSSVPEEGKSSTAVNLAVIFAEAGKKVLLVEADLRRPRVAEYLNIEGSMGLTNVLANQANIDEVLQPWGRGGLTVLPSGSIPPNPSELLGSRNMAELLESLARKFDVILLDTPPLLPVTDAAVLAAHADGAVLIVRHGKTTRQQLNFAVSALRRVDAKILGCVLNMAPTKGVDAYSYGYGYRSNYEDLTSIPTKHSIAGKKSDRLIKTAD